ncbi:MAG: sulfatase family protein [Armatimonadota bacterium]
MSSNTSNNEIKIGRRTFLKQTAVLGASIALSGLTGDNIIKAKVEGKKVKRPNLLIIFSDQQSHDMLGCYGNEQLITPNIDRFASESVRFDHCVSSCPVCTPYRGILLSGQHPLYNGAFSNDIRMLQGNGNLFGEVLRDSGYHMGYVGKWHLYGGRRDRPVPAGPFRYGFDGTFLTDNCTEEFRPEHSYFWDDKKLTAFDSWQPYGQTRQAVNFIDECKQDEPFALFVSWHPPHNMGWRENRFYYDTEPELMGLYDPAKIQLRPNCKDTPGVRRDYQGHMAMCTGIDTAFGWIIDKLKEKGLDDNTIIVYTSDHGDLLTSNGRPWPKGFPEDGSVRVPLIIRWPKALKARTSDLVVGTFDLMPTLLGMMGITVPETCQGRNLTKAIIDRKDDVSDWAPLLMVTLGQGWRGTYTRDYTYAYDEGMNISVRYNCLYNKKSDKWQQTNLYNSTEHRHIRYKLHKQTQDWMESMGDKFIPGEIVARACFGEVGLAKLDQREGDLPGRPIDLLKSAGY